MKIAVGNVAPVVSEYFESVIMPSAIQAGGLKAFSVGFVGGLVARQTPQMVEQYLPLAKALGLVDDENRLNMDLAFEEADKALSKTPFVIAGYRPDREDLMKILEIARKYSI
jgi:hypothetical protein